MGEAGFSRYQPPAGVEAETEPGSHGRVLRNRLGIRRKREMDAAEYEALLRAQEAYLQRISADTRFTASLLREMHREWLADLMALQADYSVPDYGFAGRGSKGQQERYLEAVKQGYLQDYDDLVDFFREAIERRLRALG